MSIFIFIKFKIYNLFKYTSIKFNIFRKEDLRYRYNKYIILCMQLYILNVNVKVKLNVLVLIFFTYILL